VLRFEFTSQAYLRDPAAHLAKLRAAGPVVEVRFPIVGRTWITTTSELAGRVLKDSETFVMRKDGRPAGLRWWMPGWVRALAVSMLSMDEPDHTRLRSIVDEAFRRRAILDMDPRIFAIADKLAADLFKDGSPTDLVERYARRLPLSVICELLGLPATDRARFIAWANNLTRLSGPISFLRLLAGIGPMKRYLEGRLQAARETGGEGLIAELVRVEKEGGRISSRNKTTLLVEDLLANEAETLTRSLIRRAKAGNGTALSLVFARLAPPREDRPVDVALPAIEGIKDISAAHGMLLRQVGTGALSPGDACAVAHLRELQAFHRSRCRRQGARRGRPLHVAARAGHRIVRGWLRSSA
jgi:hypothetical protein